MCQISFYLVKFDPETLFFLQRQTSSSHLVFYYRSRGTSNSEQSPEGTEFFRSRDSIKIKLFAILEQLNERHNRAERVSIFVDDCIVEEKKYLSTKILQMQKNQMIDLQELFECYCNVLPVFGFNSAKYDINLIKSYLLPILENERDIEPTVIKKADQFVSF